jgi:hypothetical protein
VALIDLVGNDQGPGSIISPGCRARAVTDDTAATESCDNVALSHEPPLKPRNTVYHRPRTNAPAIRRESSSLPRRTVNPLIDADQRLPWRIAPCVGWRHSLHSEEPSSLQGLPCRTAPRNCHGNGRAKTPGALSFRVSKSSSLTTAEPRPAATPSWHPAARR